MRRTIGIVAAAALAAAGCGGGGGGGGGNDVDNAAIRATLDALEASLRSGTDVLDPTITVGSVDNPNEFPDSDMDSEDVTGGGDNGTAGTVTVLSTASFETDGSGTFVQSVTDDDNGFEYLRVTTQLDRPQVSFRDVPFGYAGLDPNTGTGQAFIVARIEYTGTITRIFQNTNTNTQTLVAPGATNLPSDGTETVDFRAVDEYLIEYQISGAPGALVADVVEVFDGSSLERFARRGGPNVNQLRQTFSNASVDGSPGDANGDVVIPVGTDADAGGAIVEGDPLLFTVNLDGGVAGGTRSTGVLGSVDDGDSATGDTLVFSDTLDVDAGETNNDTIDVETVVIRSVSDESTTGAVELDHAIDDALSDDDFFVQDLDDALNAPSTTAVQKVFWIFN